jgi:hypothetical protein
MVDQLRVRDVDAVSTWVVNLEVRTELQCRSLNTLQIIVANDDNYALAA